MVVTATAAKTLVVNAAFLQEIKDSNPDLWHAVHELRQTCHSDDEPVKVARRIVRQLDELRDLLALQFALEESYGFVELPALAEPTKCSRMAARTRVQHCSLYLMLHDLAEQAEELQYRGVVASQLRELIEGALHFDQKLREHEQMEAELMDLSGK